jgi:hypothetical protein
MNHRSLPLLTLFVGSAPQASKRDSENDGVGFEFVLWDGRGKNKAKTAPSDPVDRNYSAVSQAIQRGQDVRGAVGETNFL